MRTIWTIVTLTICKCLAPAYIVTLKDTTGKEINLEVGDGNNKGVLKKGNKVYLLEDSSVVHGKDTFYVYK